MLYELRIYECIPGRLPDLNKAFSTIVLAQFEKHGIKQTGFWTTLIGEFEPNSLLHAGLGVLGGSREKVDQLPGGPRLDRGASKNDGKWADHRERKELHPRIDTLLCCPIAPRSAWPSGCLISCAICDQRPDSADTRVVISKINGGD